MPDELLGQRGGGEQVFAHLIEAAAVHLPGDPGDGRIVAGAFAQGRVRRMKKKDPPIQAIAAVTCSQRMSADPHSQPYVSSAPIDLSPIARTRR